MDTENLIAHARERFDHESAKRVLREKYQAKMVFAHDGGMWQAGPELICVLSTCPDEVAVLEDLYGNPIKVNVPDMLLLSRQRWQEQMTAWLVEHSSLQTKR